MQGKYIQINSFLFILILYASSSFNSSPLSYTHKSMDCLVMPVSLMRRRSTGSRLGYVPLRNDGLDLEQESSSSPVTVVVGKERRVFEVEPFILRENPFRVLMDISMKKDDHHDLHFTSSKRSVIFVDVDAILFEHMLWLMHNDASSLFQLNLKEIIDFYAQDV